VVRAAYVTDPDLDEYRRAFAAAEAPILVELTAAGFPIAHVQDLYQIPLNYRSAIPILIDWLPRVDNPDVLETVVRALSVLWARPAAAQPLIDLYHRLTNDDSLKWAVGSAIGIVADRSVLDQLVAIVQDRTNGRSRQEIVEDALGRLGDPAVIDALLGLLDDPLVMGHAVVALGKLHPAQARSRLVPLLHHDESWIRRAAKTAIFRIDRETTESTVRGVG
jgi:hypothetical protein